MPRFLNKEGAADHATLAQSLRKASCIGHMQIASFTSVPEFSIHTPIGNTAMSLSQARSLEQEMGNTADTAMHDRPDSNHTSGSSADEIIRFTNRDIASAIEELNGVEDFSTRLQLFERISRWVTSDGQTLFEYHADALLADSMRSAVALCDLWTHRNDEEKAFWAGRTSKCAHVLQAAIPNFQRAILPLRVLP